MRIGLVCQSCDTRTGIGRIANALASEFIGFGHSVACAAQFYYGADARIKKHRVPHLTSSKGVNKLLFRLAESAFGESEIDIVHTFGVGRGAHVVSAQSCHRSGMSLLRLHQDQFLEGRTFGLYDRVSLADERSLLTSQATRRIIAVSSLVKAQIGEEYRINPEMISVIPNGVDVNKFATLRAKASRSDIRMRLGYSGDDFILLFIGNEFGRKGLLALLKAVHTLHEKSLRLLVIGNGDLGAYGRCAKELGIPDRVKFLGGIPDPEVMYLGADAFVFPTLYEPFGIVVLEAMAAGLPVITSKSCGATERMQHGQHILHLADPTSVEELSEAIRLIMRDEGLRRSLIVSGIEKANEYSWDGVARTVLGVYDDVRQRL